MDFETALEMQKICTGEERELTRGQIAAEVIEFDSLTKNFRPEMVEECKKFFEGMKADESRKAYDVDSLMEETEHLKAEFQQFIREHRDDDVFRMIYDDIGDFFQTPPFEGLDNIEYGVNEVCVFSVAEYFIWKSEDESRDYDHDGCRRDYRDNIASRTHEEVGDHWIEVFDSLQTRYDKVAGGFDDEHSLKLKIVGCCIIALAAIRDQDEFNLDMAQAGADAKAETIVCAMEDETYIEGESSFTDNVVRLFKFVYDYCR